jgi:hypothetical protein
MSDSRQPNEMAGASVPPAPAGSSVPPAPAGSPVPPAPVGSKQKSKTKKNTDAAGTKELDLVRQKIADLEKSQAGNRELEQEIGTYSKGNSPAV